MEIEEKYKIHYLGKKRYYEVNLFNNLPILEGCSPKVFKYRDIEIYESSWGVLSVLIVEELQKINPKSMEQLLNFKHSWSKQNVFSKEKRTNHRLCLGLYLNCNHTSTHSLMNIVGLLKFYGIDLNECTLLAHLSNMVEPQEAKEYFKNKNVNGFTKFLFIAGVPQKARVIMLQNINILNKYLPKLTTVYDDLFLVDDYYSFISIKDRLIKECKDRYFSKPEALIIINRLLEYLSIYFRYQDFYLNISKEDITPSLIASLEKNIEKVFNFLNTDIIYINKLTGVVSILNSNVKQYLETDRSEMKLFALYQMIFYKKYYFNYPFISKNKEKFNSQDEVIYAYAFNHENFDLNMLKKYCLKMGLKNSLDYKSLIDKMSKEYLMYDILCFKRIDSINYSDDLIERIKNNISYILTNFQNINTTSFNSYSFFDINGIKFTKYLLLGFIKSFMNEDFNIEYLLCTSKNIDYIVSFR